MKYELHPLAIADKVLLNAARRGPGDYHVRHTANGWSVGRAGAAKVTAVYATKVEAVAQARRLAANQQVGFKVYNVNGKRAK